MKGPKPSLYGRTWPVRLSASIVRPWKPRSKAAAMGVAGAGPLGVCSSASRMSSRLFGPGTSVLRTTDGIVRPLTHDPGHDVLHGSVVLQRVHRHVLAVAGLLEATVRHLADDRQMVVDPDRAEAQAAGGGG